MIYGGSGRDWGKLVEAPSGIRVRRVFAWFLRSQCHFSQPRSGCNACPCRVGPERKFFVETKKPSVNIKHDIAPAFQLRRYGWSAKLALSILTDFEEFAVYDCRVRPIKTDGPSTARVMYLAATDHEIDQLVYELYGLTDDEICIVEEATAGDAAG